MLSFVSTLHFICRSWFGERCHNLWSTNTSERDADIVDQYNVSNTTLCVDKLVCASHHS
jgi:hypothetical protein